MSPSDSTSPDDQFAGFDSDPAGPVQDEELPRVEPPSAGFIVQLFVVPAMIVLAVVGVWLLFGRLAAGEHDWRVLIRDLGSSGQHRQWRAAHGLAQMLRADQQVAGVDGERMSDNVEVATQLTELFIRRLNTRSASGEGLEPDELLKQQEFLARTLGDLDVHDVILPALSEAMLPQYDRAVRKNAIQSTARIAGRMANREAFDSPEVVNRLIDSSADSDPLIRQLVAYTLGLIPGELSRQTLGDLLNDADQNTRWNAAIALARQDSTAGLDVFREVLSAAAGSGDIVTKTERGPQESAEDREFRRFRQPLMLGNTLKAIEDLLDQLNEQQKSEFRALASSVSQSYENDEIQVRATILLRRLDGEP